MHLNPHKSAFILGTTGSGCKAWVQQRVQKVRGKQMINFGTAHQPLCIPIERSSKYLGVIVSYGKYEDETLRRRLQAAQVTRQRLVKILHSSRYLSLPKRLELYTACVRSTSLYGLGVAASRRRGLSDYVASRPSISELLPGLLFTSRRQTPAPCWTVSNTTALLLPYLHSYVSLRQGMETRGDKERWSPFNVLCSWAVVASCLLRTLFGRWLVPHVALTMPVCRLFVYITLRCMGLYLPPPTSPRSDRI